MNRKIIQEREVSYMERGNQSLKCKSQIMFEKKSRVEWGALG